MQGLGARLRSLRKSRGWTQKQLANHIHKSPAAIGSYEQGVQTPPADVLISLAQLYHVSLDELVGFKDAPHFSMEEFTVLQIEALEMILTEFRKPTKSEHSLSLNQMDIINKLIYIFLTE